MSNKTKLLGILTMNDNRSECATCGYVWVTGCNGHHICSEHMLKRPNPCRYQLECHPDKDGKGVIFFDEEIVSDVQILNQLHSQQFEISRLKAKLYAIATHVTEEVNKL